MLEDGLTADTMSERLALYAEAGLNAGAELTTFQTAALEIADAPDREALRAALAALGFEDGPLPLTSPPMPETQARIARAVLESAGAEVYFADAAS